MRFGWWLAALALATGVNTAGRAQVDPPPIHQDIDANGVDLLNNAITTSATDLSIGPGGHRGMSYMRTYVAGNWFDNLTMMIMGSTAHPVVVLGATSLSFTLSGAGYVADAGNGASLAAANGQYVYRDSSGVTITFNASSDTVFYNSSTDNSSKLAYVDNVAYPDGVVWRFYYSTAHWHIYANNYVNLKRLQSVTNNSGYQLKMSYAVNVGNDYYGDLDTKGWTRRQSVSAINNAVEYCDPTADTCALTAAWPTASYQYSYYLGYITAVTDARNKTWSYDYDQSYHSSLTLIRRPGTSVDDLTVVYFGLHAPAMSVTRHGSTWTYTFDQTGIRPGLTTTIVQDPSPGPARKRYVSYDASGLVESDVNENGNMPGGNWETHYVYDSYGRPTQVTLPEGNYNTYSYDSRGNVTDSYAYPAGGGPALHKSAVYPTYCDGMQTVDGYTASLTGYNCNEPLRTTDERGNQTYFSWNQNGPIGWIKGPPVNGVSPETHYYYANNSAWYYGAAGGSSLGLSSYPINLLTAVRACRNGNWPCAASDEVRTSTDYYGGPGPTNMLVSGITRGAGDGSLTATTSIAYDAYGNAIQVTDPNGNVTQRFYNENRALTGVIGPDPDGGGPKRNRGLELEINDDGTIAAEKLGTINPDRSGFTELQRVQHGYDVYGRKASDLMTAAGTTYSLTQYGYDAVGRLECTALRMTPSTYGSLPDACTQSSGGSDRIGRTVYEYAGGVDAVYDGVGIASINGGSGRRVVHYVHNQNGQVTSLTDANGNVTGYEYDGYRRAVRVRYPNASGGGVSSSDYEELTLDDAGNAIARRLRDGTVLGYSYDALNRLAEKVRPGDTTVDYAYDNQGNVLVASIPGATLTNSYDALGRLTQVIQPFGALSYGYDAGGRRTSVAWTGATTPLTATYCYDATDAMTGVREGGTGCAGGTLLASYAYDDLGNRTGIARANGVTTALAYDPVSRLSQVAHDLAGTGADQVIGFADYNAAGQIGTRTTSNDDYAWTGHYNVSRSYQVNGLNQYTLSGSVTPTYDARGNLASAGATTYGYSSENMLRSTSSGISLYYDPANRLTEYDTSSVTRFVYDGGEIATEADASGNILRRYVTGAGADEPLVWYEGAGTGDRRWLIPDERGSIVAVTDGGGNALAVNAYDEYGIPASTNLGRFQYTGQAWLPELGMYHYKARIYSPTLGRFLQTDPIGYGDGPNWYNYAHSDPVNATDPSGMDACDIDGLCNSGEIVVTGSYRPDIGIQGLGGDVGGGGGPFDPIDSGGDFFAASACSLGGASEIVVCKKKKTVIATTGGEYRGPVEIGSLQNPMPPPCWSGHSGADTIGNVAGNIALGEDLVAPRKIKKNIGTSFTGIGGVGFGTIAAGAKFVSFAATAVQAATQYVSGNTSGLRSTAVGSLVGLAVPGLIGAKQAVYGVGKTARDAFVRDAAGISTSQAASTVTCRPR